MPLAFAFVAGGLATVNPCGFALLPALLTFYLGDERASGSSVRRRILAALAVGGIVAAGFLAVFLLVGLPITLGAAHIITAVPWAGVVTGAVLTLAGLAVLFGQHLSLPLTTPVTTEHGQHRKGMFVFGVAYGVASLGCTLPIFLSVVGASLSTAGAGGALLVMASYGLGMVVVVSALSVGAALAREGFAKRLRRLVPHINRIGGGLLFVAGVYLTYYWGRVLWGPVATLSRDPIVGRVQRIVADLERLAAGNGRWIVAIAALIVTAAGVLALAHRSGNSTSNVDETEHQSHAA